LQEISLLFINYFLKIYFNKKITLKIETAASSGGQEKLTYFVYFSGSPLEAELSTSIFFPPHLHFDNVAVRKKKIPASNISM